MLHCPTCGRNYPLDVEMCPEDKTPLQADATIASDVDWDPLIGKTLDEKYQLEERLGVGGMGTVYRAKHLLIDRAVAVKVLNPRFVEDEGARVRFQREARAAGRLHHVNAVAVTDFGETANGYVYIVMELLEGRTLRDILAREGPLETARSVSIMLQASAAVAAAHEAGIIHRDLKPANIFVTQHADVPSVVKVLDFGIAKLAVETLDDDEPKNLTQVGAMIGTPRYMSPEQCNGLELTPAADVYSLGVILYEMLTGMVPFSGTTPLAIAMKHASEIPRSLRELVFSIPEDLERLVLKALEKHPEDRPPNATAFRNELMATAERLGLEHASVTSAPDLEALRSAGVESPSGRLIIDISRLREKRATTSGSSELTMLGSGSKQVQTASDSGHGGVVQRVSFPRLNVSTARNSYVTKKALAIALVGFAVLFIGLVFFATRSRYVAQPANVNESASPSPIATPTLTPTPTPSPVASPKRQATPKSDSADKKNGSKVGSFVNKVKRIFKKPF